ncbi:MAG TPA: pitrilysin family protein [Abditibacteriaceae bacterium]|jgi:zinc protease
MKNTFTVRSIPTVLSLLAAPLSTLPSSAAPVTSPAPAPPVTAPKPGVTKPAAPATAKPAPAVIKPQALPKPQISAPAIKPPTATPVKPVATKPVIAPVAAAKPVVPPAKAPSLRELASTRKLSNGITLVTRLDRTSPRVAFSILVRAGAADETVQSAGWRRVLTEAMLRASAVKTGESTEELTGAKLQRLAERAGGSLGASVSDDVVEFWGVGDASGSDVVLGALTTLVLNPRLSDADIAAARRRVAAASMAAEDDIALGATTALRSQVYRNTAGSPLAYGLAPHGTEDSRRTLTNDRVQAYFRAYVRPDNLVVAASGAVDEAAVAAQLEKLTPPPAKTGELSPEDIVARPSAPAFAPVAKTDPALLVRQLPTDNAWVFVSFLGAAANSPDLPALAVTAALLGEAPNARLPRRLLNTRTPSLGGPPEESAQQAAVSFVPRRWGSEFVLYAQTEANAVESVKNALLDEARKLRETSVASAELERAKNYVRGSWSVDREPLRERSFNAALASATQGASDWEWPGAVQKVTAADVRRVAQKYLTGYAVALIMPQG